MILYILSMIWAIAALGAFLFVVTHPDRFVRLPSPALIVLGVSLLLRLIPAFILVPTSNYDIDSYQLVSQHVVAREDVYTAQDTIGRHPYLPFQMYWIGFAHLVSEKANVPFASFIRIAPIIADSLIALLLYFFYTKTPQKQLAPWAGLLFAINPISIYVSAYQGQFDAIPILFTLLAIWWADRDQVPISAFWLGLAILIKSWPVLAFPQFWNNFREHKAKLLLLTLMGLVPLIGVSLYVWLYHSNYLTVVTRAVTYNHGIGVWGYTYLLRLISLFWSYIQPALNSFLMESRYGTIILLALTWLIVARKQQLIAGILTVLIAFLSFTHAFSIQYLSWLLPFAILEGQARWLRWYTLAAFSYMFLAYHTLILRMTINNLLPMPQADLAFIIPAGLPVWLVLLTWLNSRVKQALDKPSDNQAVQPFLS